MRQANLDEAQMSSAPFLRALMTAVCKAAVKGERSQQVQGPRAELHPSARSLTRTCARLHAPTDDNSNCRVDTAIIQQRLPVLLKYLNSDTERQLQALYALQALIVSLDQPPSEYRLRLPIPLLPGIRAFLLSPSLSFVSLRE